ncbi:CrcB family protein [Microbacterium sp. LWH13-1.2]|uniref:fluoride efflux transporter FluC n=1 Tax=Microbacterium sp. LWH13-1.2 TaxID=3135260 RepID=UPI00313897BA
MLNPYILVFIGGAFGTLLRILLGLVPGDSEFPWVTFVINITGAALLGALYGLTSRLFVSTSASAQMRLLLGTGLMGGYTTYSTLAVGTDGLILGDHLLLGAAYAVPTVALGILSAFLAERACRTRTVPADRA